MKKLLAVLALATAFGALANAEDKGTEFKFGGELRTRYTLTSNPYFANSNGASDSNFTQRNQFNVNAITSDKMQAYFNFLHYTYWGGAAAIPTTGSGVGSANVTNYNALQVHDAWMWWKLSDTFSLKSGRMTMNYGDGYVVSANDWALSPFNADALMFRGSWDFMDLDFGGAKLADAGTTTATGTDTELNMYGLYASFKGLPDVVKTVDLMLLQVNADQGVTTSSFAPGATTAVGGSWGLMTIAPHIKGEFSMIDYRLDAAFQSGKQKNTTVGSSDVAFSGWMADIDLGVNFPEFMKARIGVGYHTDTGDDSTTADKYEGYQPLFYNRTLTGPANFFAWGNLSDLSIDLTLQPSEETKVGATMHMLTRTTDKSGARVIGTAATSDSSVAGWYSGSALSTGTDKALGTDIGIWAEHKYGRGFTLLGQLDFLTLGSYFKPAGASVGSGMQFLLQGKYAF